jgi:hypothetical protein
MASHDETDEIPPRAELLQYARNKVNTLEVNATAYEEQGLPTLATDAHSRARRWYELVALLERDSKGLP